MARSSGGASKYLANLPSRGLFSSTVLSSNPGGLRVYLCDHETSPPEDQLIKTNQTNILIRSLTLNKQKTELCSKDGKGKASTENAKGKRAAERLIDGRVSAKKANSVSNPRPAFQDGSSSHTPQKDFQHLTVDRLRSILKERSLPTKGRKDELVARLRADKVEREAQCKEE